MTLLLNDRTCNFNCAYCYARRDHGKADKVKPMTDFHAIDHLYEDVLRENPGTDFRTTFWGGEPFANPHLINVVRYLKATYGSTFHAVTNGSLITDRLADWLIENRFSVSISNDLSYQERLRGYQYLNMPGHSHAIARLCRAGLMGGFQTVVTAQSPDVMAQADYVLAWAWKEGLTEEEIPSLKFLPVKAYSKDDVPDLLLREGTPEAETLASSMHDFATYAMLNPDSPPFEGFYERELAPAYNSLEGMPDGVLRARGCGIFDRSHCFDLLGREWNCPHPFEQDPEHPVLLEEKGLDPMCMGCPYMPQCNGICSMATHEARVLSCESLRCFYRPIVQAIYDASSEEMRRGYAPDIVKDLR